MQIPAKLAPITRMSRIPFSMYGLELISSWTVEKVRELIYKPDPSIANFPVDTPSGKMGFQEFMDVVVYTGYFKDDYSESPVLPRLHELLNQMYRNEGQTILGTKRPPKP